MGLVAKPGWGATILVAAGALATDDFTGVIGFLGAAFFAWSALA
jgi:hypothetical protein